MNTNFSNDLAKGVSDSNIGQLLDPGSKRRWEPECGIQKHNERIHRESKWTDDNMNLPFKFSKPKKHKRMVYKACSNCGAVFTGTTDTIGVICKACNQFTIVKEVNCE